MKRDEMAKGAAMQHDAGISRRSFVRLGSGFLLSLAAGVSLSGCEWGDDVFKGEKTVVDDAGRTLNIPSARQLERVYFTSALAGIFCFTLAPDLIVGAPSAYSAAALAYLPERMASLPVLGSLGGTGEIDREMLMLEDVQLIFSVSAIGLTPANISEAEELQDVTGIPVVLIDGSDLNLAHAYSFMGDCLGVQDRGEELAGYCTEIYDFVTSVAAQIPEDERKRFYYAEGSLGTQTEPFGSQHAIAFDAVGGYNVCRMPVNDDIGLADVSMEQVIGWDPDYVITTSTDAGGAYEYICSADLWSEVSAVKNNHVYAMPYVPFNWVDRPPAVNRYLGMHWLCYLFYREQYEARYDIVEEVRAFYRRFYWREITEEEAIGFLGSSYAG